MRRVVVGATAKWAAESATSPSTMTRSENLFDAYCRALGYAIEQIPTQPHRTADRLVKTPAGAVIVEIKELTPNDDDLRYMKELSEQGWSSRGGTPGNRVFEKIRSAAPQLKAYSNRSIPCVLVLYDNVRSKGWRIVRCVS